MQDFQTLIRALIERRFSGSEARLAAALDVNRSTVHRIAAGEKTLSLKAIDAWADALGLEGQEREDFTLAVRVADAHPDVHRKINDLEARLDRMDRESRANRDKMIKLEAALRARRSRRSRRAGPGSGPRER